MSSPTSGFFINTTGPDKAQETQTRKIVRSHAARVSASRLVRKSAQQPSAKAVKKRKNPTYLLQVRPARPEEEHELEQHILPGSSTESSPSHLSTPSPLGPFARSVVSIPAAESHVYFQPYVPIILDNYLAHLAVAVPEIDGSSHVALLRTVWFPVVLHSPAIFHVILLFSAAHFAARSPQNAHAYESTIQILKQCALHSINRLASSMAQTPSDEIIAAAAKMASYEAIFGDKLAYHTHMQAVKNMLQDRGGLMMLGLDGLLTRLLLFIDTNSAYLLHTHLYLQESRLPKTRGEFPRPNIKRFIGSSIEDD